MIWTSCRRLILRFSTSDKKSILSVMTLGFSLVLVGSCSDGCFPDAFVQVNYPAVSNNAPPCSNWVLITSEGRGPMELFSSYDQDSVGTSEMDQKGGVLFSQATST